MSRSAAAKMRTCKRRWTRLLGGWICLRLDCLRTRLEGKNLRKLDLVNCLVHPCHVINDIFVTACKLEGAGYTKKKLNSVQRMMLSKKKELK